MSFNLIFNYGAYIPKTSLQGTCRLSLADNLGRGAEDWVSRANTLPLSLPWCGREGTLTSQTKGNLVLELYLLWVFSSTLYLTSECHWNQEERWADPSLVRFKQSQPNQEEKFQTEHNAWKLLSQYKALAPQRTEMTLFWALKGNLESWCTQQLLKTLVKGGKNKNYNKIGTSEKVKGNLLWGHGTAWRVGTFKLWMWGMKTS